MRIKELLELLWGTHRGSLLLVGVLLALSRGLCDSVHGSHCGGDSGGVGESPMNIGFIGSLATCADLSNARNTGCPERDLPNSACM